MQWNYYTYHSVLATSIHNGIYLVLFQERYSNQIDFGRDHSWKYKYKVKSFKIIEKADINVESKFEAHLSVNICSENYLRDFLSDSKKSSSTEYNILHGDERNNKKLVVSWVRKCHHYIRKRTKSGKVVKDEELAEPKTAGKDTGCPALIKFKLKKTDDHEQDNNCDFSHSKLF